MLSPTTLMLHQYCKTAKYSTKCSISIVGDTANAHVTAGRVKTFILMLTVTFKDILFIQNIKSPNI